MLKNRQIVVNRIDIKDKVDICCDCGRDASSWGLTFTFTDETQLVYSDLCSSYEDLKFVCDRMKRHDDIYKVHVPEILENLLNELYSTPYSYERIEISA